MPTHPSSPCDAKPVAGKTRLKIYTDGSSLGNTGPSGWAYVVVAVDADGNVVDRHERSMAGRNVSTNNRAEMAAALNAMQFADSYRTPEGQPAASVMICTDSQYVLKGFTEWLPGWMARGWRKSNGDAVENRDLWERLMAAAEGLPLTWHKIKGHSGHPENERADQLAKAAAERAAAQLNIPA
ncbi:ribonuclease HI [Paracoccus liaowanqingii]|uniref:Ribonuclease H n=1 Tax=Paracoccus liaowanqingii TaxID=2560053 RepID=A0A4Z1CF87_9RHOB|nr:ribonuclease H [Paracoccus liaowanqingii]TGN53777.1 ribonuclease HI [Paracoccus liaowanqingii]